MGIEHGQGKWFFGGTAWRKRVVGALGCRLGNRALVLRFKLATEVILGQADRGRHDGELEKRS